MNKGISINFQTPAPDAEMIKLNEDLAYITDPDERQKIADMAYQYFLSDKNKGNFESAIRSFMPVYRDYRAFINAATGKTADKALIEQIETVINKYYLALDNRHHGSTAQDNAFGEIQQLLGMEWIQGEAKALEEAV